MEYESFFEKAFGGGKKPLPYQKRLAESPDLPEILMVPTGLGKTASVTLAWIYRKTQKQENRLPRRLIWCLPMRVLVEQTLENIRQWLKNLGLENEISTHILMGGSEDVFKPTWASQPEKLSILIGTQDMLLSRALMRGYGMSRYQWPAHFAQLHNDALWVFDEVQLMGPSLFTSAQLEAFRRQFSLLLPSRSLWVSATLKPEWLATVDLKPFVSGFKTEEIDAEDRNHPIVIQRIRARKQLHRAESSLTKESAKEKYKQYIQSLSQEILEKHQTGTQTLVILNQVERAQLLYQALQKNSKDTEILLLHARFRAMERRGIEEKIKETGKNRILIATQAIEAGVDISSATLFTELAPWSSLVQRFGRCNRYGEETAASIFLVDLEESDQATPYEPQPLTDARKEIDSLLATEDRNAGPEALPVLKDELSPSLVLRKRDFLELFNTDADLSGFDMDISPFIRDTGIPSVQVFWRNFDDKPEDQPPPSREELCPAGISQIKAHLKNISAWTWDSMEENWRSLKVDAVRPGMVLLLKSSDGGYDPAMGFRAGLKQTVPPAEAGEDGEKEIYASDPLSTLGRFVSLREHLEDTEEEARKLCEALGLPAASSHAICLAALLHDTGKAHPAFQSALTAHGEAPEKGLWAKSAAQGKRTVYRMPPEPGEEKGVERKCFRHELASMLSWIKNEEENHAKDLIAYLIAAHHGKVRMGLRAMPGEKKPKDDILFARGVWEGDVLPAISLEKRTISETTLSLDLMQMGEGPMGPSWTDRTQGLLKAQGPFCLALMETLVRIADWRASKKEMEENHE